MSFMSYNLFVNRGRDNEYVGFPPLEKLTGIEELGEFIDSGRYNSYNFYIFKTGFGYVICLELDPNNKFYGVHLIESKELMTLFQEISRCVGFVVASPTFKINELVKKGFCYKWYTTSYTIDEVLKEIMMVCNAMDKLNNKKENENG